MGTLEQDIQVAQNLAIAQVQRGVFVPLGSLTPRQQQLFATFRDQLGGGPTGKLDPRGATIELRAAGILSSTQTLEVGERGTFNVISTGVDVTKIPTELTLVRNEQGTVIGVLDPDTGVTRRPTLQESIEGFKPPGSPERDFRLSDAQIKQLQGVQQPTSLLARSFDVTESALRRITQPLLREEGFTVRETLATRRRELGLLTPKEIRFGILPGGEEVRKFGESFVTDTIRDIRDKPLRNILLFGAGGVIGGGVRVAGFGAGVAGRTIGGQVGQQVAQQTIKGITVGAGVALTGIFAAAVAAEAKTAKLSEEVGGTIGVAFKDIALLGFGGVKGERVGARIIGRIRTRGLQKIPIEDIADPKVRTKEQTFPLIKKGEKVEKLIIRFDKPKLPGEIPGVPRGFTAADIPDVFTQRKISIGKIILSKGKRDPLTGKKFFGRTIKSEFPGRFAADVVSEAFLRTGAEAKKPKLFGLEDFGGEPTIGRTELPLGIRKPITDRGRLGLTKARAKELDELLGGRRGLSPEEILSREPRLKEGEAIAPFTKTEREIIIRRGQEEVIAKRFATEVEGVKVPIIETRAIAKISKPIKVSQLIKGESLSKPLRRIIRESSKPFVRPAAVTPSRIAGSSLFRKISSLSKSATSDVSKISRVRPSSLVRPPPSRVSRISPIKSSTFRSIISGVSISKSKIIKRPFSSSVISPLIKIPTKIPGGILREPKGRRIKIVRRRRERFREDITIAEGFTAKTLGLKPILISKKDIARIARRTTGLEIRRRPVVRRRKR